MKLVKIFCFLKISRAKFISDTKVGTKKMQLAEHPRVLTLLQKGHSVIAVARDIGVSREAIWIKCINFPMWGNLCT